MRSCAVGISFKGRHFEKAVILQAVRWYLSYALSYRDVEELLAERGMDVDHSTIARWVRRYAPLLEIKLPPNQAHARRQLETG
jgi:IS6 family transposase